jgi:hypothetical protein
MQGSSAFYVTAFEKAALTTQAAGCATGHAYGLTLLILRKQTMRRRQSW